MKRLALLAALIVALTPGVASAAGIKPIPIKPSTVPSSSFGGGHWRSFTPPSSPIYNKDNVLVQRAPFTGSLLPYSRYLEGYDAIYATEGTSTYASCAPVTNAQFTTQWYANLANGSVPLKQGQYPGATISNADVQWIADKVKLAAKSQLPLQLNCTSGAWLMVGAVRVGSVWTVQGNICDDAVGGVANAATVRANLQAAINASTATATIELGPDAAHSSVPFSLNSSDVVPAGNWHMEAVVNSSMTIGIYDDAVSPHKWAQTSTGYGYDFGIFREPPLTARGAGSYGGELIYYTQEPGGQAVISGDGRAMWHRVIARAWGGKNADGTYWWHYRAMWSFGNSGRYMGSTETSGHVAVSATPPTIHVRWTTSGSSAGLEVPATVYHNGTAEPFPVDLTPGAYQPIMLIDNLWGVWAGYEDNLPSAVPTASVDQPFVDSPTPEGPAVPSEESSNTGFWTGAGWGWTQDALNGVATSVGNLPAGIRGFFWPIDQMNGW